MEIPAILEAMRAPFTALWLTAHFCFVPAACGMIISPSEWKWFSKEVCSRRPSLSYGEEEQRRRFMYPPNIEAAQALTRKVRARALAHALARCPRTGKSLSGSWEARRVPSCGSSR